MILDSIRPPFPSRTLAFGALLVVLVACAKHSDAPATITSTTLTIEPGTAVTKVDLKLEAPTPGSHVRTVQIPFRGRVTGVKELAIQSTRVALDSDGRFDAKVEVPAGRAEIVMRDPAPGGAGEILKFQLTVDLDAPLLELTELPGLALKSQRYERLVGTQSVHVKGQASDAPPGLLHALTVDGTEHALAKDGSFELDLALDKDSSRAFDLALDDRAGNRTRLHLNLVRDPGPPEIRVDKPAPGPDGKYGASVRIVGRAQSGIAKCVWIRGEQVELAPDGSFTKLITLAQGANTIPIQAEDQADRKSDALELQLTRP